MSTAVSLEEKQEIIGKEYQIPLESDLGKGVKIMCNLSEGVLEQGIEQGIESMIVRMYEDGLEIEQIARIAGQTAEAVQMILEKYKMK